MNFFGMGILVLVEPQNSWVMGFLDGISQYLMSEAGYRVPFAELTAEELAAEVETALKALNSQDDEGCHRIVHPYIELSQN